jgi:hypothetical protein
VGRGGRRSGLEGAPHRLDARGRVGGVGERPEESGTGDGLGGGRSGTGLRFSSWLALCFACEGGGEGPGSMETRHTRTASTSVVQWGVEAKRW